MTEAAGGPDAAAPHALPGAPRSVAGEGGEPAFGRWEGPIEDAGFAQLAPMRALGFVQRRFVEKRWQYVLVATPDAMLALAIVDLGYLSSGFCAIFDRGARRLLANHDDVLPPLLAQVAEAPGDGASARLRGPFQSARFARSAGRGVLEVRWGAASVELTFDFGGAPPPLTAVAPCGQPGRFDLTQKSVLVPVEGELRVANTTFPVRDAFAGLDFTHGLLPRETAWRWAFGMGVAGGHALAFNLSEEFLAGEGECAVWIDGALTSAGPVQFAFEPADPLAPWRIASADGALELRFSPEGFRSQDVDLSLVRSRYVQPFGTFAGHVTGADGRRVRIDGLPGVTECHSARW